MFHLQLRHTHLRNDNITFDGITLDGIIPEHGVTAQSNPTQRPIFRALFLLLSLFILGSFSVQADSCCATELDANADIQSWGGADELYRVQLPSAGLLTIDLLDEAPWMALDDAPQNFQVDFLSHNARIVAQSSTYLVLAVDSPESLTLTVRAPRSYRLMTEFTRAHIVEETFFSKSSDLTSQLVRTRFLTAIVGRKGDPEDIDPDPDSSTPAHRKGHLLAEFLGFQRLTTKGDPEDIDPDPDVTIQGDPEDIDPDPDVTIQGDPEDIDPDPDRARPTPGTDATESANLLRHTVPTLFVPLCDSKARPDDHADSLNCGTHIRPGTPVAASLETNSSLRGPVDADVFAFDLQETQTIRLRSRGNVDTFAILYNEQGQELVRADDGADGHNFLLIQTLSPGRYTVRVVGVEGDQGPYELEIVAD